MKENLELNLSLIQEAYRRISKHVLRTPLVESPLMAADLGWEAPIYLKLESLQHTGSFKARGAANKILSLIERGEKPRRIYASSAGNHAQAVAFMAKKFNIEAVIVMPEGAPLVKVNSTEKHGAQVILHGAIYDDAYQKAKELNDADPDGVFIHPYDDFEIVAGQGTAALEAIEDLEKMNPDILNDIQVVLPVGGGGLSGGVSTVFKNLYPASSCYGVVSDATPAMALSLKDGAIKKSSARSRSLADGLAIKSVCEGNFQLLKKNLEECALVSDSEVARAITYNLHSMKLLTEGAGAAGVAAVLHNKLSLNKKKALMIVLCGGNIDLQKLSHITERSLRALSRRVLLEVTIEDKPGQLSKVTRILGEKRANVLEVSHDRLSDSFEPGETLLVLDVETRGDDHYHEILKALEEASFVVRKRGS